MAGRPPDYRIVAKKRDDDNHTGRVGAMWANPDGSFSIKLDPFVMLNGRENLIITAFKADK